MARFQSRLEHQIRSRMGAKAQSRKEVEDVFQETIAAALESLQKLKWQGEEPFYRWLGSIAEHLIWSASKEDLKSPLALERDVAANNVSPRKAFGRTSALTASRKPSTGFFPTTERRFSWHGWSASA